MKATGTRFASRALLALLASVALCTTSRAAEPVFSLGVETQALSEAWRMREGYRSAGVLVTAVAAGSPAASAGLEPGDILVSLGSRVLRNPPDLRAAETAVVGGPVSVVVARDGGRLIRIFNIGDEPEAQVVETSEAPRPATTDFGMRCANLGRERASELGAPDGLGVLVRAVNAGSTAEGAGIAAGDVITFAADKSVANVDELEAIIAGAESPLAIVTVRQGTTRWLTAEFVTPAPPAGAAQLAGAAPASAGHSSETASVNVATSPASVSGTPPVAADAAASPAPNSATLPAAVDAAASPAHDSATPAPATAAGAPPAAVAPVSGAITGSETASDALVAALLEEVLRLREEVRKLREEMAKLAR